MSNEVSRQVSIEKNFDQKSLINEITCSVLEYLFTSDYNDIYNGVTKPIVLEPSKNN